VLLAASIIKCGAVVVLGLLMATSACASRSAPAAPTEVTGLITALGRATDGSIESFTLRDGDRTFEIRIDPGRDYGFSLEHLKVHRDTRAPVRVRVRPRDGALYAVEILDA
jgi:hypothetical protein